MNVVHADRAIAKKILQGDENAFRELFDSFFPRLYRFALVRLNGDQEEAREMVQQTFCKAFERLDSYRGEASLYGWMCQICRNTITDMGRRRQREYRRMPLLEEDSTIQGILETLAAPAAEEPENTLWRQDIMRLIQATLDNLPGHYGDVLEWKYVDGLSVKEIANQLGVGPKAAESLLTRARTAFREAIATITGSADVLPRPIENSVKG
ncbi:MAG: sigma-70 family RNA polymerase sigma factor [Gammaproteobacteria bacterium]|nr:sigma-70 family RNA polymerase sigma factor [Gammaproteobacteria bacterium]